MQARILGTALSLVGVAGLLVLALGSCGGGGGGGGAEGPPDPEHILLGEYMYAQLTGPVAGLELRSEVGTAVADGEGTLTFVEGYATVEGALTGPFAPPARSYHMDVDRNLTVTDIASLKTEGRVTSDGSLAALASDAGPEDGGVPALLLLARRRAAPTLADLAGSWTLVSFGRATGSVTQATGMVATVDVDGAGEVDYSDTILNHDGVIPGNQIAFIPSKITPAAGGWLQWTNLAATQVFHLGGMSADGNLIFLIAREEYESRAVLRVLVREGLASSAADLVGSYGSPSISGYSMYWMSAPWSITCNGSGSGTFSEVEANDATITYSVGPTGRASITIESLCTVEGAVGPGGHSVFLGGSTTDGIPPVFQVLIQ